MRTRLRLLTYTLLICAFFSGGAYAQINYSENFETFDGSWEGTGDTFGTTAFSCNGTTAFYTNLYFDPFFGGILEAQTTTPSIGTSNGGQVTFSFNYKLLNYGNPPTTPLNSTDWGNIEVSYATSPTGPYTVLQTITPQNHVSSMNCATKTATFYPPEGQQVYLRFYGELGNFANDFLFIIDDIVVTQAPPVSCTGAPAASAAATSVAQACTTGDFMLSLSPAYTNVGLTYQWQSSTDGTTFTNVATGGTTQQFQTTTAITRWYRAIVTCTASGQSTTSTPVQVTSTGVPCYCNVDFVQAVEPITLVNFAGINNTTSATVNGTPDVENFTAMIGNVIKGATYPIILKGNTDGATFQNFFKVYIDFNNNGNLNDVGESFEIGSVTGSSGTDAQQAQGNITIPAGAVTGNVRMRVFKLFNLYSADPCGNEYGYGQVEDYTLNITPSNACTAAPAMSQVNTTRSVVCNTATAQLSLSIPYIETGITYKWQSSTDGTTFTDIATATQSTYTTAPSTVNRYYRAVITCNTTLSTTTAAILITALGVPCPCDVLFEEDVEPITLVNFAGINNTTSNVVNGTPALQDFTGLTPGEVTAGSSYPIVLKGNTAGEFLNTFTVYIDFNHNGLFTDAGEAFAVGTIENSDGTDAIQATGSIAIPSTALAGATLMRVVKLFDEFADDPCSSEIGLGYGQVEDYLLNVTVPQPCATPAPTADLDQYFCDAATVDELEATGTGTIVWYADATGGTALDTDEALVDGETYYAAQVDGCESILRSPVTVIISLVEVDEVDDASVCSSYTLPALTNGTYYTEPNGAGDELEAGDEITENATIYIYAVSATPAACTAESSFTITIIEVNDLTGASEQAFEVSGTIADLEVTGDPTGIISWYASEEDAEQGINALEDTQALENGIYYASQLVGNCRSDAFAVTVSIILDVKGFDATAFTYYPNPVKDVLTLSYSSAINSIEVYNFLGQQVMTKTVNQNEAKLDMSQFASGTYMVKLNTENGSTAIKILKQ